MLQDGRLEGGELHLGLQGTTTGSHARPISRKQHAALRTQLGLTGRARRRQERETEARWHVDVLQGIAAKLAPELWRLGAELCRRLLLGSRWKQGLFEMALGQGGLIHSSQGSTLTHYGSNRGSASVVAGIAHRQQEPVTAAVHVSRRQGTLKC